MATKQATATKNGKVEKVEKKTKRGVHFHDPTGERQKSIPASVYYNMESSPRAQMDFMAHFMTTTASGEKYYSKKDALEILFQYSLGEIKELFQLLSTALGEGAFPKD